MNLLRMPRPQLPAQLAAGIVPSLLWLWLFFHLHVEWTFNAQYNYGWAVPFLGLWLFYFRWQRRPAGEPAAAPGSRPALAGMWLLLLLLFPIRVVEEANPDWRLLSWVLALIVVTFSLLSIFRAGGMRWVRHFAFPICFPLAAVPWPVQLENVVVQTMMRGVASIAVEIAGWLGVGAYQVGNVIQLRNGFVGVDEACSGVKTFQAGIMVALVLGEFLRLPWGRRIALLVVGCGWIFLCNVFRATALVLVAAHSGLEALGRWHDVIGTAALLCGLAGTLVLAWLWKRELDDALPEAKSSAVREARAPQLIALGWLAIVFAGTEYWYRSHERQLVERPSWEVSWPTGNETVTSLPIPETTRVILHYDDAKSAAWEDPRGVRWWSFFARWKPQRAALQLVRSHSPEICLPAIGRTFRAARRDLILNGGGTPLEFRSYEFEQNGRPLFVFVCIQEDKRVASSSADSEEWNLRGRLRAAFHGKRNLGQRLLEIAVSGLDDFAQAADAVSKTVPAIVKVENPTD
jgi:exosortase